MKRSSAASRGTGRRGLVGGQVNPKPKSWMSPVSGISSGGIGGDAFGVAGVHLSRNGIIEAPLPILTSWGIDEYSQWKAF